MQRHTRETKLKRILSALLALLLCVPSVPAPAASNLPDQADGSKIESVAVKWLTEDSPWAQDAQNYSDDDDHFLFLAPSGDKEMAMQYQVDISLSGQMDYQPGDIEIRIPAQVWHPRKYVDDGNGGVMGVVDEDQLIGSMKLSIPAAPSKSGDFNWTLVNNEYVITNVSTIGATKKIMMQFTIDGLKPHEIVDQSTCEPIVAECKVTTAQGNQIALSSEELTAQVDTFEKIDSNAATKFAVLLDSPQYTQIPAEAWNKIGGYAKRDEYVFVLWRLDLSQYGNQPYTLALEDVLGQVYRMDVEGNRTNVTVNPIMLEISGVRDADVRSDGFSDQTVSSPVFLTDPETRYVNVYMAYAKTDLPPVLVNDVPVDYYMGNTSEWTLTEADRPLDDPGHGLNADPRKVTVSSMNATVVYTPVPYSVPGGVTIVRKTTENGEESQTYEYVLNHLQNGEAAEVPYLLKLENFAWTDTNPDIYNFTEDRPKTNQELAETTIDPDHYGTLGWRATAEDYRRVFNNSGEQMDPEDFEFSSVQLGEYTLWRYGEIPKNGSGLINAEDGMMHLRPVTQGTVCYYRDDTLPKADVKIEYKENGTGDWLSAATAKWGTDGKGSLWFDDVATGIEADPDSRMLKFPHEVSDIRYIVTSNCYNGVYVEHSDLAGIELSLVPTITVLPTDKNVEIVNHVLETLNSPSIMLENDVRMYEEGWIDTSGDGHNEHLVNTDKAIAFLMGVEYGVWLKKTAEFDRSTDDDVDARTATVHYSGSFIEESNISDMKIYRQAMEDGALPVETKGVFYDLLPEGFMPVMSTLRTDNNDRITGAYVIRSWQGSARDLLVVEVETTPAPQYLPPEPGKSSSGYISDVHHIYFDAVTSYDEIVSHGQMASNFLAYESLSDLPDGKLGTKNRLKGASDSPDPSVNKNTPAMSPDIVELLTGLDPNGDPDDARFVYAQDYTELNVDISAVSGLSKMVREDLNGAWTQGLDGQPQATVYEGHDYTYRLELSSGNETVTRDMFLFDTIENYHVPKDDSQKVKDWQHIQDRKDWPGDWEGIGQWRGTLNSVDLSEFIAAGVAPVLYVSTVNDLVFADSTPDMTQAQKDVLFVSGTYDVTDTAYWTKVELDANGVWTVPASMSGLVTAIAVDASRAQDGDPFELQPNEKMNAYLHMTAPDDDGDENLRHAKGAYAQSNGVIDWEAATDPANNMYAFNNSRLRCVQTESTATTSDTSNKTMIRNDYTRVGILPEIMNVEKIWDDDDNHDGSRPAEIVVSLKRKNAGSSADPEPVLDAQGALVTLALNEANEWNGQFFQIDIVDENGVPYLYSFTETLPDGSPIGNGYSLSWHRDVEPNYQLTNRRENETVQVNGVKHWDDMDNTNAHRPSKITVNLYCDDSAKPISTLEVEPDLFGQWKYDFGSLERYKRYDPAVGHLEEHVYRVEEDPVDYYVTTITDYTSITNTYAPVGNVEIVKTVTGLTDANKDHLFEYKVEFFEDRKLGIQVYDPFTCHVEELAGGVWSPVSGTETTVTTGDMVYLKANQKIVIEDLPTLTQVCVTESEEPAYEILSGSDKETEYVVGGKTTSIEYENQYKANGELNLFVGKQLTGRPLKKGEFSFTVREKNSGNDEIVSTGRVGSITNNQTAIGSPITGTGTVAFSPIHYTEEDAGKTFVYEISEDVPAEPKPGLTYDQTLITVSVTVEDNGDGTLSTTMRDASDNVIADGDQFGLFKNKYEAECDVTLELKKVLEGRTLQDQEFEFELCTCDENGENAVALTPTVRNSGDSVTFSGYDALHFDQDDVSMDRDDPATYYFLAREIEGTDSSVDYTRESKLFTVKVYDAGDGTLTYSVGAQKMEPNDTVCEHCCGTGEVPKVVMYSGFMFGEDFNGKIYSDRRNELVNATSIDLSDFSNFNLASGITRQDYDEYWGPITWNKFICKECLGFGAVGDHTHMDDITVNSDGSIEPNEWIHLCPSCEGSGIDPDFVGGADYYDEDWDYVEDILIMDVTGSSYPYVGKAVVALDPVSVDSWFGYLFMIGGYKFWNDVSLPDLPGKRGFNIHAFEYDFVDCPVCDGTGGSSGVNIVGDPGTPVLTNKLKPGTLRLTKKAASAAIPADEEFEFVVTLTGDGMSGVDSVTWTSSLDPANTPAHTVDVVNHKVTVTLVKDETVSFPNLPDGTAYEITEVAKSAPSPLPGYVTVSKDHETGTIATNEDCNATFVNGIGPCEFTLQKAAPGVTAKAAEKTFTFDIYLEDMNYHPLAGRTVTATPSLGEVTFGSDGYAIQPVPNAETLTLDTNGHTVVTLSPGKSLTFVDLPEGTLVTVRERSDDNAPGWTLPASADASSADKLQWVYDAASGTCSNVVTRTVTNVYEAKGTLNLTARKVLTGRDLLAGEFTFALYRSDENGQYIGLDANDQPYAITGADRSAALLGTAVNTSAGDVSFEPITLTEEGTQWYLIRELIPASVDPTLEYSDETILVRVPVIDREGKGHLDVGEYVSDAWKDGPFYTNLNNTAAPDTLTNRVVPAALCVEKEITGGTPSDAVLAASTFTAELSFTDPNGDAWTGDANAQITATNGTTLTAREDKFLLTLAPGASLTFTDLPVGLDYAVTETGTLPGWLLDPRTYTGTTVSCVTDEDIAQVTLVNEYDPKGTYSLSLRKTLTDRNDQRLPLSAEQFSFVVADAFGKTVTTAKNEADGTVTFDPISLTLTDVGTHTLFVREVDPGKPGYETDARVRSLTLTVKEDPTSAEGLSVTGVLSLEDGTTTDADLFKNKYDPLIDIPVTKIWNDAGHTDQRAEVTLSLYAVDMDSVFTLATPSVTWTGAPADLLENPWTISRDVACASDIQSGTWYGLPVADSLGRPYTYVVKESGVPEDYLSVVSGDQKTGLQVTNKLIFTEVPLEITKTVDGEEPWEDEVFSFTLADAAGDPVGKAVNNGGKAKFDDLFFTASDVGTHVFTVTENASSKDYYEIDDAEYTVTVTVTADTFAVTAVPGITKDGATVTGITFDNTYNAEGKLLLPVTKTVNGKTLTADRTGLFSFTLENADTQTPEVSETVQNNASGKAAFSAIGYTKTDAGKTYTYTVTEEAVTLDGYTGDTAVHTITVSITDNKDGTLTVTPTIKKGVTAVDAIVYDNQYEATGDLALTVTKTVNGRTISAAEDGMFSFNLKGGATPHAVDETVDNDASGKAAFTKITFTEEDISKTFVYTVKETTASGNGYTADPSVYTVTVTVRDNGDGTLDVTPVILKGSASANALVFDNQYEATGSLTLTGTKEMEGRDLKTGDDFTFTVKEGSETVATGANNGSGVITFTGIVYTLEDVGSHTYTVTEDASSVTGVKADPATRTVKVDVTDNGDGTLSAVTVAEESDTVTFVNVYEATGSITFTGEKKLTGRDFRTGDNFQFTVREGKKTVSTGMSLATSRITFSPIEYTLANVGEHTYTITEAAQIKPGLTTDTATLTVKVLVSDNGDGTLKAEIVAADSDDIVFENVYEATGTLDLKVQKTVNGASASADHAGLFSFSLTGETDPHDETDTADLGADAEAAFETLTFTQADAGKSFTYTVKETTAAGNGYTPDTTEYTVTVDVTDNGDGTLTVTPSYQIGATSAAALVFDNVYEAEGQLDLTVTKTINGVTATADRAGLFSFTLENATGTPAHEETKQNGTDGKAVFTSIEYTEADIGKTYVYTVTESDAPAAGYTVDPSVYTVTAEITDHFDGTLNVKKTVTKGGVTVGDPVFNNIYAANGDLLLTVNKTVNGASVTGARTGLFSFTLKNADSATPAVNETKQNDADGKASFSVITYTTDDIGKTFRYTVTEEDPNLSGYTADDAEYTVEVTVSDNGDGTLKIDKTFLKDGQPAGAITFDNEYAATGSLPLSLTKTVNGASVTADQAGLFSFQLKGTAAPHAEEETKRNDATGKVAFTPLTFTESDIGKDFTWTVTETTTAGNGYTPDTTVYTVIAKVTDNGDGTLAVSHEIKKGTESAKSMTFNNVYEAEGQLILTGVKTVKGRDMTASDTYAFTVKEGATEVATGANNGTGTITFTKIPYTLEDVGSHTYTVTEDDTTVPGITKASDIRTVKVDVTDNGDGTLSAVTIAAESDTVTFVNVYEATGSITFTGEKKLTGRDFKSGDNFMFTVCEGRKSVSTGMALGTSRISFSAINYTLADVGEHTYTITEAKQMLPGLTTDDTTLTVTVLVSDNGDGTLKAEIVPAKSDAIVFENVYEATGTLEVPVTKTVNGKTLTAADAGKFSFSLTGVTAPHTEQKSADNNADSKAIFEPLTFTVADVGKTFTYTVKETTAAGGGYTPDATEFTVVAEVTDNGNGTLTVKSKYYKNAVEIPEIVFDNLYEATGVLSLTGQKSIEGRVMTTEDKFSFTVTEKGTPVSTGANDAAGNITFDEIVYTLKDAGTHTYLITEDDTSVAGITKDPATRAVTVYVSDNGDGTLSAVPVTDQSDTVTFVNVYEAMGSITFTGEKKINGREIKSGDNFLFTVREGTKTVSTGMALGSSRISFSPIWYTLANVGEHTYTITEAKQMLPGLTTDPATLTVTVLVSDNGDGTLKAEIVPAKSDAIVFENVYKATGTLTLDVTKTVNGASVTAARDGMFSFNLAGNGADDTKASNGDGVATFDALTFTEADAGKSYTYTVKELPVTNTAYTVDATEYTVDVEIADNGNGTLNVTKTVRKGTRTVSDMTFDNAYKATGSMDLAAVKTVNGVAAGADRAQLFSFTLQSASGTPTVNETVKNGTDGTAPFTTLYYNENDIGKTYTYTVIETGAPTAGYTADPSVYTVIAEITDLTDGTLAVKKTVKKGDTPVNAPVFDNTYIATGDLLLSVTKTVNGASVTGARENLFTFTLKNEDGTPAVNETKANNADGKATFSKITYTQEDIGKTFVYTVKENDANLPGYTCDSSVWTVTVLVTDKGDGTLAVTPTYLKNGTQAADAMTFDNTYRATGTANLSVTKTVNGAPVAADETGKFSFNLKGGAGARGVDETKVNDVAGVAAFTELAFDESDIGKTYVYTVKETTPSGNGYTKDATEYTVKLEVIDLGDGTLKIDRTITKGTAPVSAMTFDNLYAATGSILPLADKELKGRVMTTADRFSFTVTENGNVVSTGNNNGTASVTFSGIDYTLEDVGLHTYVIAEEDTALGGVTKDDTTKTWTVLVTDNRNGTLSAVTVAEETDTLTFTNCYEATGSITLSGQKALRGRDLTAADRYAYTVQEDGKTVATGSNDINGAISFSPIAYGLDEIGIHTYTVTENKPSVPGVAGDGRTLTVKVEVRDRGDGTLSAEVLTAQSDPLNFTNVYTAFGTLDVSVNKTVNGKALQADEAGLFLFNLKSAGDAPAVDETVRNDANGVAAFTTLRYTIADAGKTYTYTLTETTPDGKGYTSDKRAYTMEVEIRDNGNGTLAVTRRFLYGDSPVTVVTFDNTYTASGALNLTGTKAMEGRALKGSDAFNFTLKEGDKTVAMGCNDEDGNIAFTPVTYTLADAGTHTYTVTEEDTLIPGVAKDGSARTVTVRVTDQRDGTLRAAIVREMSDPVAFRNIYTATGDITFTGSKMIAGRPLDANDKFIWTVTEDGTTVATGANNGTGTVTFTRIPYTLSDVGKHIYTVTENASGVKGVAADPNPRTVTVLVSDRGDGTLKAEVDSAVSDPLVFENPYTATGSISFIGSKSIIGRSLTAADRFSFTVRENGTQVANGVNNGTGVITFSRIDYSLADVGEHTYIITENASGYAGLVDDATARTVKVRVSDNGDGTLKAEILSAESDPLTFENIYVAKGGLSLTGSKTMKGRALMNYDRYTFSVKEGEQTVATGVSDATGVVTFSEIVYTLKDVGPHTYTVTEDAAFIPGVSVDPSPRTVTVMVTDNGNGTVSASLTKDSMALDFVNQYTAKGYVDLPAELYMEEEGEPPLPGEIFDFVMTDKNGNTVDKQNDGTEVDFGRVEFTLDDLGTHTWEFRQKQRVNGDHVTDNVRYRVTVTVTDNGNGTLRTEKTVTRIEPDGTETLLPPGSGVIFVNYRKGKLTVTKQWQGGESEQEVIFYVYRDGELVQPEEVVTDPETGERVQKINYTEERNGLIYTFRGLANASPEGKRYTWTLKEKGLSGYLRIYMNVGAHKGESDVLYDGATVINKAVTDLRVRKVWEGLADTAPKPEITLVLYCNGEEYVKNPIGPDADGWYVWKNLPEVVNGQPAEYYVLELPVKGMSTRYVNVGFYDEETDRAYDGATIVNASVPKTGDTANPLLWAILAVLSLSGCGAALIVSKKKRK